MRRGVALLLSLSALGWLTPALFAQYPYPYAPPAYNPAPMPYGYYPPMPYQQAPMPYGYYPQAPMPMPMNPSAPRVFVYGPLEDPQPAPAPAQPAPQQQPKKLPDAAKTTKPATQGKSGTTPAKSGVAQAQSTSTSEPPSSIWSPPTPLAAPSYGACGPQGCGDGCCSDTGCSIPRDPPQLGHGQFIGEIGANILVPYPSQRLAYTTTANGQTSSNDFPHEADASPFVSLGYLCHNGWGVRADYWYLTGSEHQTTGNGSLGTTIANPVGTNYQFTSPSPTLAAGIGADGYNFAQRLTINVADLEGLKEVQFLDTTFLFGAGARYARISQSYTGTQNNPGGANGVVTVTQDLQTANSSSVFDGWGPTVSLEVIHAIPRSCFSVYGNVRGSFLWGDDTFNQSLHNQNNTIAVAGVAAPIDTTSANSTLIHREASIGEAEVGVQYGGRCGPCYVFVRAGASFQRWWDVGSSITPNGSLSFIGGVARVGVSY